MLSDVGKQFKKTQIDFKSDGKNVIWKIFSLT